jgi:hypothetical protein
MTLRLKEATRLLVTMLLAMIPVPAASKVRRKHLREVEIASVAAT